MYQEISWLRLINIKSIEVDRNNLDAWKNIASMHYFGDGVQEDKEMAKHIHDVIIKNLEEDDWYRVCERVKH